MRPLVIAQSQFEFRDGLQLRPGRAGRDRTYVSLTLTLGPGFVPVLVA